MTAIITQARVNSRRLPNKIFKEADGISYLQHHIERLRKTNLQIIIATTNNGSEMPIINFCKEQNIQFFCGDELNVLQRFYECALQFKLSHIIRVTSDCPLIDAEVIKRGLEAYKKTEIETYYSNTIKRSYPRGLDYEIFSFKALQDAYLNATEQQDKEHVTPYINKNKSGKISVQQDAFYKDISRFRITLDTQEDETLLKMLIENYNSAHLSGEKIAEILMKNPKLSAINAAKEQK